MKLIYDTLDEVDNAILDILDSPNEEHGVEVGSGSSTSSGNPLILSIDLHLADLQSSSRALYKLISKCRPEGPVTPKQESQRRLPTPESGLSSHGIHQVVRDDRSVYSRDSLRDHNSSPDLLEVNHQRYTSSPTASPTYAIAPLKIPVRGVSPAVRSSTNLHLQVESEDIRSLPSPFDYELEYLNRQISETSSIGRLHFTNPGQLSPTTQQVPILRSVKSVEFDWAHKSRPSLDPDSDTWGASSEVNQSGFPITRGHLLSASQGGLGSIGGADVAPLDGRPRSLQIGRYSSRHFSTEENTRRLRTMRQGFASAGSPDADSEPLRLEELMEFLREGNSIRDL
ncbi:hypothetical protein VP1G_11091 [Cytospora mali]|uniref:Uncharacterized protein n=1 Tax=Cytospora mali TaxID=578113 RepID=A0A194V6Q0_CYTMA|nr:hypothetical protein VP1G_11091 [Valsa mali var. pyri (nom. inval.)]